MTEIIAGELVHNELTVGANGGTELMARRMVKYLDPELLKPFQIIHSRVRELRPDLKKILVCHDLANDPEVAKLASAEYRAQFEKIVFVSNWQAQLYNLTLGIPYREFTVIPNAIEPFPDEDIREYGGKIRLIYHTTPHRGLDIAVPVVETLSHHYDIHFDVFSSFQAYNWGHADAQYEKLFDRIRNHSNMTYHGFQPNSTVREYLRKAHVFLYPSIWPETSCIAAIESLAAGVMPVHPNFGALPETCEHSSVMYQYTEDRNAHARVALTSSFMLLKSFTENPNLAKTVAHSLKNRYNNIYQWQAVEPRWQNLLKDLIDGKKSS